MEDVWLVYTANKKDVYYSDDAYSCWSEPIAFTTYAKAFKYVQTKSPDVKKERAMYIDANYGCKIYWYKIIKVTVRE